MVKKLKPLPRFKNEDEERDFWDTHDSTEYIDWSKAKHVSFPNLKMSNFWFTTWDVLEYKEWAQKKTYGYLLTIIRKQPQDFLAVKAKLIFKAKGLPQFVTLQSSTVKTGKEAREVIKKWQGVLTIL